jgi:exodeoxyribonuclease V alpha subunit
MQAHEKEFCNGTVERVTFHSEESGFCVIKIKARGKRDLVTVTGNVASISAGEFVECAGNWFNDKNYGLQFKSSSLKVVPPTTLEGIEKYLGSGLIKGIGPVFAKVLVKGFGEAIFDVIDDSPDRLLELDGIGPKRVESIAKAWEEQKAIRSIMVFLQSHGIGVSPISRTLN